jgi:hypothetical protein
MKSTSDLRPLKIEVAFYGQEKKEDLPRVRAYLFDRTGQLVASEQVEKGIATLQIEPEKSYRIKVGPDLLVERNDLSSNLALQLAKAKAVTKDVNPQIKLESVRFPIPKPIWYCWWETCVIVHGTVRKLINPGDPQPKYLPICNGIVQIFQVDLGCTLDQMTSFQVLTLRDLLIDKLRGLELSDEKLAIIRGPIPPGPMAKARRIGKASARLRHALPVSKNAMTNPSDSVQAERLTVPPRSTSQQSIEAKISMAEIASNLSVLEGKALNQYIIANRVNLRWILCHFIPDWAFCWQELGEVPIQTGGSFMAEICFWCPQDFPDLYFEVVQNLNGVDTEVYDPQIACNTYYNYDGSQSVDIIVNDPRAVACLPDPGSPISGNDLYVWPTAIGNIDLSLITDLENNPAISSLATGLVNSATPWGGTLSLQVVFDPRLKTMSSIRYYRWSYKFDGDAEFKTIGASVTHRFMTVTYSPFLQIHLNPVTLGPKQPIGGQLNLFEVPDPFPGDGWVDINDPIDRPFAYFDSTDNNLQPFTYTDALPRRSGLCTLMLEMFDGAGNLVPCSNLGGSGPFKFVLPDLANPGQYTSLLTSNNITPQGQLIFRVRIDNNDTVAQLTDVTTPSGSADKCGILHYNDPSDLISVHYAATHPNNYLNWWLSISRGLAGIVSSASGSASSPPMSLPAPSTPGEFINAASTLLGKDCANAAFAVNLDVDAIATDGYNRQWQYDRDATIAFALLKVLHHT